MKSPLLVSIVTYHDESFLEDCLTSLQRQSWPLRVKILDNGAGESVSEIAARYGMEVEVPGSNLGFSGGHNRNLLNEEFEWALLLNADVILRADFLENLMAAVLARSGQRVGSAGGKLLRMEAGGNPVEVQGLPMLDSTGIYFTPTLRHFDRGGGRPDRGQYEAPEWVFGISGAGLLIARSFYEDLQEDGEFLDEDFFAYREDADLAWRGQLRGWNALYVPSARALHARRVTPRGRRQLAAAINLHSVKNRFLMRRKNIDGRVRLRAFPYMWMRDLAIVIYVLLFERTSLPAFRLIWKSRQRMAQKRHRIQSARIRTPREIAWWFSFSPRSRPAPEEDGESQGNRGWNGPAKQGC